MMSNDENNFSNDLTDLEQIKTLNYPPPKGILRILTVLSILTSLLGIIVLISILIELSSATTFSYLPGLLIGILLLGGGIILLISVMIINSGSHQSD